MCIYSCTFKCLNVHVRKQAQRVDVHQSNNIRRTKVLVCITANYKPNSFTIGPTWILLILAPPLPMILPTNWLDTVSCTVLVVRVTSCQLCEVEATVEAFVTGVECERVVVWVEGVGSAAVDVGRVVGVYDCAAAAAWSF